MVLSQRRWPQKNEFNKVWISLRRKSYRPIYIRWIISYVNIYFRFQTWLGFLVFLRNRKLLFKSSPILFKNYKVSTICSWFTSCYQWFYDKHTKCSSKTFLSFLYLILLRTLYMWTYQHRLCISRIIKKTLNI